MLAAMFVVFQWLVKFSLRMGDLEEQHGAVLDMPHIAVYQMNRALAATRHD